jgi:hypothetical protein
MSICGSVNQGANKGVILQQEEQAKVGKKQYEPWSHSTGCPTQNIKHQPGTNIGQLFRIRICGCGCGFDINIGGGLLIWDRVVLVHDDLG